MSYEELIKYVDKKAEKGHNSKFTSSNIKKAIPLRPEGWDLFWEDITIHF